MVMPIGLLMTEHRLIERMITLMRMEGEKYRHNKRLNPLFVDAAVDFIRTYADKLHHGKEEDILFRELKKKNLSDDHQKTMEDLIEEHKWGRKTVEKLVEANEKYKRGDQKSAEDVMEGLADLVDFYPRHIEKEDKHFFLPCMEYFGDQEQQGMLQEEQEFDRGFVHRLYEEKVERMEQ
jgi:hemerythrin-like domain-containing protein